MKTPTGTPSIFDGKSDVEEFIREYKLACKLNQWSDQLKIHYLPLYLKGPAKVLYENEIMPKQINTWAEIEVILRKFYTPVGIEDRIELEMLSRRQQPNETAEEYVQENIRLINKFNPNMMEDRKVKLVLYGLLPDIIAKVVCMGNNSTIERLRGNIRKTDLANYMVNVSVKGFDRFQFEKQEAPVWSGTVNNIDIVQNRNIAQPTTSNDVLLREIAMIRGDLEKLKMPSAHQTPNHRNNYHNRGTHRNNHHSHSQSNPRYQNTHRNNHHSNSQPNPKYQNHHFPKHNNYGHENNQNQQGKRDNTNIPFERTSNGKLIKCHRCNELGHMARHCWSKNV